MKESIQQFIERKNKFLESREGHNLHVIDRLIAIDGVDGSGKDTISDHLLKKLMEKFGSDNVVKIDVTHFLDNDGNTTELGDRVLGKNSYHGYFNERKQLGDSGSKDLFNSKDQQIDKAFIATVNRAYTDKVIPALENGKIVIIPRSELNLLRFVLQIKDVGKIDHEMKCLLNGTTTAGVLAGNRIFISITPENSFKNIKRRGYLTHLDPQNLQEAELFVQTQKEAEKIIFGLPSDKKINVIRIQNDIVESGELEKHIDETCNEIIKSLNFAQ